MKDDKGKKFPPETNSSANQKAKRNTKAKKEKGKTLLSTSSRKKKTTRQFRDYT